MVHLRAMSDISDLKRLVAMGYDEIADEIPRAV
jgi:hypothetical protein